MAGSSITAEKRSTDVIGLNGLMDAGTLRSDHEYGHRVILKQTSSFPVTTRVRSSWWSTNILEEHGYDTYPTENTRL
jgi:hypothetical protein